MRFALELVRDLGLLAGVGDRVGASEPAGGWRSAEPSARFADLVVDLVGAADACRRSPATPTARRFPAVRPARRRTASAMILRWAVIAARSRAQPAGDGLVVPGALGGLLSWRLPTKIGRSDPAMATIWTEAHDLGVLAQGALTPDRRGTAGRRSGRAAGGQRPGCWRPATTRGPVRLGPDRDGRRVTVRGGQRACSIPAPTGKAAARRCVWRFSPASVRRALDEGASRGRAAFAALRGDRGDRSAAATDLPDRRRAAPARIADRAAGAVLRAVRRRGAADRGGRAPQSALAAAGAAGADGDRLCRGAARCSMRCGGRVHAGAG